MKKISTFLKNIRNLIPYVLLVAVYFFFVNLEARKEKNNNQNPVNKDTMSNYKSSIDDKNHRIEIPVIPYND